jgi:hypothetical protein
MTPDAWHWTPAPAGPRNGGQITFNSVYGMMTAPWCPHEGCGWSMPQLTCPRHGNYGMTFLSARVGGVLVHVKAVLDRPFPAPDPVITTSGRKTSAAGI